MEDIGYVLRGLRRLLLYSAEVAVIIVGVTYTFGTPDVRRRVEQALAASASSAVGLLRRPLDAAVDQLGHELTRGPQLTASKPERPNP